MNNSSNLTNIIGVIIGVLALIATVATKEVRSFLCLDNVSETQTSATKSDQSEEVEYTSYDGKLKINGVFSGWSDLERRKIFISLSKFRHVKAYFAEFEEYIPESEIKNIFHVKKAIVGGDYKFNQTNDSLSFHLVCNNGTEVFTGKLIEDGFALDFLRRNIKTLREERIRFILVQ